MQKVVSHSVCVIERYKITSQLVVALAMVGIVCKAGSALALSDAFATQILQ